MQYWMLALKHIKVNDFKQGWSGWKYIGLALDWPEPIWSKLKVLSKIMQPLQCTSVAITRILHTAKFLSGKTFAVFQPIVKVFTLNHLLCTVHDGHSLIHHESFPVNSVFCSQPQKFSNLKVLLYTVSYLSKYLNICKYIVNNKSYNYHY